MSERSPLRPGPDVGTPIAPFTPERLGAFQRIEWVYRRRWILEGGSIGEDKGNGLAGFDRELEIVGIEQKINDGGWAFGLLARP